MFKWLKKLIKESIEETLTSEKFLPRVLSKEDVNIVYVPVGRLPKLKAEQYIKDLSKRFKEYNPEYKIFWMAVGK